MEVIVNHYGVFQNFFQRRFTLLFIPVLRANISWKGGSARIGCRLKKDALNKKIFRGMRSYLMKLFDFSDLARGKHHWCEKRWT